jgi:hypothetical protein
MIALATPRSSRPSTAHHRFATPAITRSRATRETRGDAEAAQKAPAVGIRDSPEAGRGALGLPLRAEANRAVDLDDAQASRARRDRHQPPAVPSTPKRSPKLAARPVPPPNSGRSLKALRRPSWPQPPRCCTGSAAATSRTARKLRRSPHEPTATAGTASPLNPSTLTTPNDSGTPLSDGSPR